MTISNRIRRLAGRLLYWACVVITVAAMCAPTVLAVYLVALSSTALAVVVAVGAVVSWAAVAWSILET